MPLGIGLYGMNGHQVQKRLAGHSRAALVAIAGFARESLPPVLAADPDLRVYGSLDEMLNDARVQLVSLCSPRRQDQLEDAIHCLNRGRHVYAEKPATFSIAELDRLLGIAAQSGYQFHEMADTAFATPYFAIRNVVREGRIGKVLQVVAQKSYPYHDRRPTDEAVDGGIIRQAGIHAVRFIEHVAGVTVTEVHALESTTGAPDARSGLCMSGAVLMRLSNGGTATFTTNYLNPAGSGVWGNDRIIIWGTDGFVESLDGGKKTRLVIGATDHGPLDTSTEPPDFFDAYIDSVLNGTPMPLDLETELHPLRVVLRAKESATQNGVGVSVL